MDTHSTLRTSFFDDDNLSSPFEFQKPDKTHQKNLNTPAVLADTLFKQISPDTLSQKGVYALHNTTLAYYKNNVTQNPDAVLNLAHSRLHPLTTSSGPLKFGFSLMKNGMKYEFYSSEQQVIENWFNALKSVCVQTNFHEEYKASKMIGKGSFAKVYLVESKTTGKNFAVKAFTKESLVHSNKSNAKPSMLNEIEIMRALDHENVIKLYEVYETEKSIYLVLELIQGKPLQDVLKKSGFLDNEARTINVISSILEALSYIASKGIMHRDLKPDNILLDKGDKVKIVDFGLATFIDLPEYIFKKCGTPGYIAPEVFKYDPKVSSTGYDDRCDVFSAGCILFYMLFGNAFFEGLNASQILQANRKFGPEFKKITIVKQELKNPKSILPKEALNLLLQLLEMDPKKRPNASNALTHPYLYSIMQQKLAGSYDVYKSGGYSPSVFDKRGSFVQEHQPKDPSTPHQRFDDKGSLYLDLGKPELNGKIDTLANGSANNSLLLTKRDQSVSSPKSSSPFSKTSPVKNSPFKTTKHPTNVNNQSVLKAAIFNNMQKHTEDEEVVVVDNQAKNGPPNTRHERHRSELIAGRDYHFSSGSDSARDATPDDELEEVSQEDPYLQRNMEKMKSCARAKHPSKLVTTYHSRQLSSGGMIPKGRDKGFW